MFKLEIEIHEKSFQIGPRSRAPKCFLFAIVVNLFSLATKGAHSPHGLKTGSNAEFKLKLHSQQFFLVQLL
jgi:hypothetical protein